MTHVIPEPGITFVKEIELPEAFVCQRSDGLFHVHFKKDVIYDIPLQLRLKRLYTEITEGKRSKFIFSAEEGLIFTKEARENAREVEKDNPVAFYALVVNNLAYKLVANFYLKVMKPKGHFRMVSDTREAARWLHSMTDQ